MQHSLQISVHVDGIIRLGFQDTGSQLRPAAWCLVLITLRASHCTNEARSTVSEPGTAALHVRRLCSAHTPWTSLVVRCTAT